MSNIATCVHYYWPCTSYWFGNNTDMEMCAICGYGACLAMTKQSFVSCAGLMERPSWLGCCGHGCVSMGIYYSRHNYAVGRFVSQSIRTQLFIRLPVIAVCWRHASHTHYTCVTHTHTLTNRHIGTYAHTILSVNISLQKQEEASRKKCQNDNYPFLSFSYSFVQEAPTDINVKRD